MLPILNGLNKIQGMRRIVCLVVCCLTLTVAKHETPFRFGVCKPELLNEETGIIVSSKDWKGGQFVNIVNKVLEPKLSCVHSSRWTELDTTTNPPFLVFHQSLHYKLGGKKGFAKFSEMYRVHQDHYVFKYSHNGVSAKVHVKWLKLLPGALEVQYMCSDEMVFAKNVKDFVLVTTPSAMFSSTVGALTRDILQRHHIKLRRLMMVPNCDCGSKAAKKSKCVDKPLLHLLNK